MCVSLYSFFLLLLKFDLTEANKSTLLENELSLLLKYFCLGKSSGLTSAFPRV